MVVERRQLQVLHHPRQRVDGTLMLALASCSVHRSESTGGPISCAPEAPQPPMATPFAGSYCLAVVLLQRSEAHLVNSAWPLGRRDPPGNLIALLRCTSFAMFTKKVAPKGKRERR